MYVEDYRLTLLYFSQTPARHKYPFASQRRFAFPVYIAVGIACLLHTPISTVLHLSPLLSAANHPRHRRHPHSSHHRSRIHRHSHSRPSAFRRSHRQSFPVYNRSRFLAGTKMTMSCQVACMYIPLRPRSGHEPAFVSLDTGAPAPRISLLVPGAVEPPAPVTHDTPAAI
jgi:hypothetical protein